MEAWMKMSRCTLNAADHMRGTGVIRGFAACALDRAGAEAVRVREPVMNLSVVTTRLSIRSLNCDFTENMNQVVRLYFLRKRPKQPETISAGTSLGSLRNVERHACSTRARALALSELPPSILTTWSNLVNATTTGTESRISTTYKSCI